MKQTQTHVWSLAGEEAVSYSLARGKAAAVTRESGEVAAYSLARAVSCTWAVQRRDRGKTPKPLLSCLSRYISPAPCMRSAWGAHPEDHVIINY